MFSLRRKSIRNLALPVALVDALTESGLSKSKGDARKTIGQGGVYVNNKRVDDVDYALDTTDYLHDRYVVLRRGKRDYHLLSFR